MSRTLFKYIFRDLLRIFLMTSGEATVQRPRRQWRPEQRAGMEMQALEAAVRGASEDLVNQLGRQ